MTNVTVHLENKNRQTNLDNRSRIGEFQTRADTRGNVRQARAV